MIKDGRMTQYFVKVKSSTETTPSTEPEYWSKQIISGTQANLFYNLGNVGIGVPNPLGKLQVDGNVGIGSAFATYAPPADGLIVVGNVGIGTSAPAHKLHVIGNARIEGNLIVNGTQTIIDTDVQTTERLDITNNGTGPALRVNQTGASDVIDILDNGVSVLNIKDGGYVGIGTTAPIAMLHVEGPVYFAEQRFKALPLDTGGGHFNQMFAIRGDGELMCWGRGDSRGYNLGLGTEVFSQICPRRVAMPFGKKVAQVTMNRDGATALTTDGLVYSWGYNGQGQVGDGTNTDRFVPVLIPTVGTVTKIYRAAQYAEESSTYYMNNLGDIYRWGFFITDILPRYTSPTVMPRPTNSAKWKNFTASLGSVWAWTEDSDGNKAYAIGKNDYGQLGDGTTTNRTTWVAVLKTDNTQLSGIQSAKWTTNIEASGTAYFLLANGDLYTCGYNGYGECGVGNTTTQTKATFVIGNVRDVNPANTTAGTVSIIKTDGTLWAWGYNGSGQVGDGTTTSPRTSPIQIRENGTSGNFITSVKSLHGAMGNDDGGLYFIKEDGSVYVTGYGTNYTSPFGIGVNGSLNTYRQIPSGEPMENVFLNYWFDGTYHLQQTFYLARSGRLYSCGYSGYGALGNPGNTTTNTLVQVLLGQ